MTGDAFLGSYLQIVQIAGIDMALGTGRQRVFTDQVERDHVMVKALAVRVDPVMTSHAVRPEGQEVFRGKWFINGQVTISAGVLIERRDKAACMAIFTDIIRMCLQGEAGGIVIERDLIPRAGIMTGGALRTIRTLMRIILGMTGAAVLRRTFENAVDMTALAIHGNMFPIKMECEFGMIHFGVLPTFGSMTRGALGSKLTVVVVIL